jgi:hypothetical protein
LSEELGYAAGNNSHLADLVEHGQRYDILVIAKEQSVCKEERAEKKINRQHDKYSRVSSHTNEKTEEHHYADECRRADHREAGLVIGLPGDKSRLGGDNQTKDKNVNNCCNHEIPGPGMDQAVENFGIAIGIDHKVENMFFKRICKSSTPTTMAIAIPNQKRFCYQRHAGTA